MRKLDKLVISYFGGPFVVTFFLCLFVLLMQFLWKYVDDLVGKGLEWYIIAQLLFYCSANLIPMALPLGILLASLMTLGNIAENYEMMAFKSAGISLLKVMRPLLVVIILICILSFYFANDVLPKANMQFGALMWDIKTKKPVLDIKPGIFYDEIDGYSMRIGSKNNKTSKVTDVLIYDHTGSGGDNKVIKADYGEMLMSDNEKWLIMKLYDGTRYEEIRDNPRSYRTFPQSRIRFKEFQMRFDLSGFKFNRSDIKLFRGDYRFLKLRELKHSEDSIVKKIKEQQFKTIQYLHPYLCAFSDTLKGNTTSVSDTVKFNLIKNIPLKKRRIVMEVALKNARNSKQILIVPAAEMKQLRESLVSYRIEWYRKITLAFSIFVLFLIGAPLGAIIRKGGFGLPVVISIFLFILYYIISLTCEKLAKQYIIDAFAGMWIPVFVLLPIGGFLVYKANRDSMLFSTEGYNRFYKTVVKIFTKKKNNEDTPTLLQDAISS